MDRNFSFSFFYRVHLVISIKVLNVNPNYSPPPPIVQYYSSVFNTRYFVADLTQCVQPVTLCLLRQILYRRRRKMAERKRDQGQQNLYFINCICLDYFEDGMMYNMFIFRLFLLSKLETKVIKVSFSAHAQKFINKIKFRGFFLCI